VEPKKQTLDTVKVRYKRNGYKKINEDGMGRAYSTHLEEEEEEKNAYVGTMENRERDYWEDIDIGGST
jgi:hypothetical protein